ncbi:C13 family peptidase [Xanthomonas arboricola]|uniref:C13 family peptidase n=3 Tax=Xanthomonas arboricola pv. pruni TaxID=69929 RepID=A0AAQ1AMA9_9XANT|nr:C13 family peptidase [Xanthomonas arboricola]KCW98436.1 peptidase C13 [Xanthomonas arboricola pv. pruni]KPN04913.1 peptidase C13 [Xanthomonas arboricola pv. pruni]MDN0267578.1 C13 family peptidase [Xanthomonas arboricola pv. pruni]MDN0271817.1 C13 family peptidase [Xanthomonas arboricola pv. pruni]MDN0276034.1 C13 family peptidase [Xanthomonas arboricola pv. pruni]
MSLHSPFGPNALLRRLSLLIVIVTLMAGCHPDAGAALPNQSAAGKDEVDPVDQAALAQALNALQPQRPGVTDLYVVGFAGDASDDVFRNETLYLRQLFEQRFAARGRVVTLVNNPDNLGEQPYAPLATYDNLYDTLAAIGKRMDRKEDALLLFVTTHGTEDHTLYVQVDQDEEDFISPQDLRQALDDAGIGNRIIVLSACYSGGFIPALRSPDTLILTAARADRPSFGCGNTSNATYFGQAWLIDAMNRSDDPLAAFDMARTAITAREKQEGELPSLPQQSLGKRIAPVLARWRAGLHAGAAVAYPYPPLETTPDAGQDQDPEADPDSRSLDDPTKAKEPAAPASPRKPSPVPAPATP